MQRRRCCANISMDISIMVHVKTMQRRIFNANISMGISTIMNVVTMQRRRCCAIILMNKFCNINVLMVQRRRCCSFDSPGLTSESEVYPGSFAVSGNNAVGVVPFIPRLFVVTFHAEKAQHLRR